MKNLIKIFLIRGRFPFYKRTLALVLALVMVFNLTCDIFAQKYQMDEMPTGAWFPFDSTHKAPKDKLSQELEKNYQAQEIAKKLGYSYESYQKDVKAYAQKNNIDINTIDMSASWKAYTKELLKYNNDYKALSELFNKETIWEVITDGKYYLKTQSTEINYNGKKYNRIALLHAVLHNLATRNNTGYVSKGIWIFSKETEQKFSVAQKVDVIKNMRKIIEFEGFYPQDRQALWAFAYTIVENGKKYFDNDTYKADIIPGLSDKDDRQKAEQGKDKRLGQANAVADAISLLPILSQSSSEKTKSAQVIYDLAQKVMRDDYGAIAITMGSEALIALKTDDSLNKLYTLLSSDLYRSFGTEVTMYFFDSFSVYEWVKRIGGSVGNGIKNGIGQYHNAIARRFLYMDPKKNSADRIRIASKTDESLQSYYNVVYTDILEDIGKTLGSYSQNSKVAALNNKLVAEYIKDVEALKQRQSQIFQQKSQTPYEREKNLHTSIIVGILAKTKVKNENLTKAAKIIYNGNWWDLNEATQRDKNNIAAKYLGAKVKGYNEQKQKEFAALTRAKTLGRFLDIFVQAAMMGKLVLSLPSIVSKVGNVASRITRGFKIIIREDVVKAKSVQTQPTRVQPVEKPALKPAEPAKVAEPGRTPALKPAEPVKVAEPAKAPSAEPVKVTEPVKANVVEPVAEPVKVSAESAIVNESVEVSQAGADAWISENTVTPQITQEQITKAAQSVKSEMLGQYYQRPAAMSLLPFGPFNNISKRITAFLTNRPYLSDTGIKKVKAIIDEAATEVAQGVINDTISISDIKAAIKEKVFAKIQKSAEFTAKEKAGLLSEFEVKAAEEASHAQIKTEAKAQVRDFDQKYKAEQYFKKGNEYSNTFFAERGRWKTALRNYNKAIELVPDNAEYYYKRALVKRKLRDIEGSLEDLEKARKLDPANVTYENTLAEFKVRNLTEAEKTAVKKNVEARRKEEIETLGTSLNSGDYAYLAKISADANDYRTAVEYIETAIKLNPNYGPYRMVLKRYEQAMMKKNIYLTKAERTTIRENVEARVKGFYKTKSETKASQAKTAEEVHQAELARQRAAESAKIKAEQKAAEEARQTEFAKKYFDEDATQRAAKKRTQAELATQKAYDDFEETISKERSKEVKAQYLIKQANLLRNANGTGRESIIIEGSEVPYKKAAMLSYDRAIEYAPTPEVKAKYLSERSSFKYMNGDLEGAKMDLQTAGELDPKYKKQPIIK